MASLLLESGRINGNDLAIAEQQAVRDRVQLADAIVALGQMDEPEAYALLARSVGADFVDLQDEAASELATRLVPERLARRHQVVPLRVDNRTLTYATYRPFDDEAERDLAFASGRPTRFVVAARSAVMAAIDRSYPKTRELDVLAERLRAERPNVEAADTEPQGRSDSAVIDMCNHIIGRAVEVGASDVHIEGDNDGLTIRYRICGVLEPVLTLPATVSHPIRNRFKIMGRADIAVRHRPQDGAFRIKVSGRPVEVRLSIVPTMAGVFLLVPGLIIFATVFLIGAWQLFGQAIWHVDAWRERR